MESIAGILCETLIPIKHRYHIGNEQKTVAICTLSSIDLLETISKDKVTMSRILLVGRLLSENKGIDTLVRFALEHPNLCHIIVCGKEVKGHEAGQALLSLHRNGINKNNGRIIGATGAHPLLVSSQADIESFRKQTILYDLIGIENMDVINVHLELIYE